MGHDFLQAYEDHVWHVYGFFTYRGASRADAEDLTQVTFERALRAWGRFDERKGTLAGWLLTIARNALVDHRRRDRSRPSRSLSGDEVSEAELPTTPGPAELSAGLEPELASALDELSQRDREVLALRFGADLRGPEIAEMLDLSLSNVQQILSRALRKLRATLESMPANMDAPPKPGDEIGERRP